MNTYFRQRTAMLAARVVAVAAATGCGADGPELFRVETLDGVPHSVAADVPHHGDSALELIWDAPSPGEVLDGAAWANPTEIVADHQGVAVLDPQLSRVHLFRPDGARAGSIGRRGGGPGELTNPVSVALHGDTVMIRDFGRPALQLFTRAGEYLGGFAAVEGMSFGFYHLAGVGVLRSSVVPAPGVTEQQWSLIGYNDERRPLTFPGDHPLQPHVQAGEPGCWRRSAARSHLVEVDCTFPLIRIVTSDGQVLREHRIDRVPTESTPDQLAAMAAAMRRNMGEMGGRVPPEFIQNMVDQEMARNRWAPVMRLALGAPSGDRLVLWEQLSSDLGGGDGTLHVLNGEGRYLVRHEMGVPLQAVTVTDDRIYVLALDPDTDLRWLRAYRLP